MQPITTKLSHKLPIPIYIRAVMYKQIDPAIKNEGYGDGRKTHRGYCMMSKFTG